MLIKAMGYEILLSRDFVIRQRVTELYEYHKGVEEGHHEFLLFRSWLFIISPTPKRHQNVIDTSSKHDPRGPHSNQ